MTNHPNRSSSDKIATLDELLAFLRTNPDEAAGRARGIPVVRGEVDWTDLPTFGGDEPSNTAEVWSWDEARLLVGTCAADIEIINR